MAPVPSSRQPGTSDSLEALYQSSVQWDSMSAQLTVSSKPWSRFETMSSGSLGGPPGTPEDPHCRRMPSNSRVSLTATTPACESCIAVRVVGTWDEPAATGPCLTNSKTLTGSNGSG